MTSFDLPDADVPQILIVSDRADPPPFWVRRLAAAIPHYSHVELAPERPGRRNLWAARLDEVARSARQPMLLVAYGVSCHAVSWWARLSPHCYVESIAAAVFVRPAEGTLHGERYKGPRTALPFTAVVVDDRNDDARSAVRSRRFARAFGHSFLDFAHPDLAGFAEGARHGARERLMLNLLGLVATWLPSADQPALEPVAATAEGIQLRV